MKTDQHQSHIESRVACNDCQECRAHGVDAEEMFEDIGERDEYGAQEVLDWLGY